MNLRAGSTGWGLPALPLLGGGWCGDVEGLCLLVTFAPVLISLGCQLLHPVFPKYRVWAESYLKPCPVWTSWTRPGNSPWGGADGWRQKSKIGWPVPPRRRADCLLSGSLYSICSEIIRGSLPLTKHGNANIIYERQRFGAIRWDSFPVTKRRLRWAKRLGWCGNWTPFQVGAGQRQLSLSWPPTWVPAPVSLAWAFAQRSLPFYLPGSIRRVC